MKKPLRKTISTKIRSRLQKEVQSKCPFCEIEEVEYFEVHHIDENPSNNVELNLILVCPTCHSKITKGDITADTVRLVKSLLPQRPNLIEFASVTIDSKKCNWKVSQENEYAFFKGELNQSYPFPIFNFTLINHSAKTMVLKTIHLKVKDVYSGIHGLPKARVLKPVASYTLMIEGENNILHLENPIAIDSKAAFLFQIELSEKAMDGPERYEISGSMTLAFEFEFNGNYFTSAPKMFLNCNSEKSRTQVVYMH